MRHENLVIEIGGAEDETFYDDLISLEVELDDQLTGMFRMTIAVVLQPDGTWTYLDDERFTLWQPVTVSAGLDDDMSQLISGFITRVRPEFGIGLEQCHLEVWGMDASVLMDRADRLQSWPDKRDSDIATDIFSAYGLTPEVTDTTVIHDEQVSTIIQRETDMQFLKRLALRNGFEVYVDGDTGFFGPPGLDAEPQPVASVQFGDDTTITNFRIEADALAAADVVMWQIDHMSGEVLEAGVEATEQPVLGASLSSSFLGDGQPVAQVVVAQTVATGVPEMVALCQGLFDRGQWFVTAEGDIAANDYGTVLKPRATLTLKGIGETHSGVYYVTHVTHHFMNDGYQQHFKAKRNALLPTGEESFDDDGDLLGGLL